MGYTPFFKSTVFKYIVLFLLLFDYPGVYSRHFLFCVTPDAGVGLLLQLDHAILYALYIPFVCGFLVTSSTIFSHMTQFSPIITLDL